MEEYKYNNYPPQEEEGLDIMELVRQLWSGRKTIIICTCVFILLGLVAALTMKRTYSVSTVMVPQMSSSRNSSLSSLASLAGFDLGMSNSAKDLSPLVYPQIVSSVPFRKELMHTPLHFAKADTAVSLYTYAKEYAKPSLMAKVKKYTIGLPFTILGAIRKDKGDDGAVTALIDSTAAAGPRPIVLSKDEAKLMGLIGSSVSLVVDKKEGFLTLTANGFEPLQTAELCLKAQTLLQEEVTRFRTEKAQSELDYVQARYDEIKAEAESYQAQLAAVSDRSQEMIGSRARIQRERIQQKYTLANAIYTDMAKQLEQARMQVKRDTPVLTVIQPVTVPSKPSNSRAKTLIVWTFLGFVLGCGIVLAKGYWPKLKEQLAGNPETGN